MIKIKKTKKGDYTCGFCRSQKCPEKISSLDLGYINISCRKHYEDLCRESDNYIGRKLFSTSTGQQSRNLEETKKEINLHKKELNRMSKLVKLKELEK